MARFGLTGPWTNRDCWSAVIETHSNWPQSSIPYKCSGAAPDGGYWFGADPTEQTQYGNWAHRFGALSADLAKEHSKPQWGIEATAANLIEHHGIHGAMWTIVTQTKDYSEAWKLHGDNTMFIKFKDFHMWGADEGGDDEGGER